MIPASLRPRPGGRVCACGRACERGVRGWVCVAVRVRASLRTWGRGRPSPARVGPSPRRHLCN